MSKRDQFSSVVAAFYGQSHDYRWRSLRHGLPSWDGQLGSANHALTYWTGEYIAGNRDLARGWLLAYYDAECLTHRWWEVGGYGPTHHADHAMILSTARRRHDESVEAATLDWWDAESRLLALCCVGVGSSPTWTICRPGGRIYATLSGRADLYPQSVESTVLRLLCGLPIARRSRWWSNNEAVGARIVRDLELRSPIADHIVAWVEHGSWATDLVGGLFIHDRMEVRRWPTRTIAWLPDGCRTYQAPRHYPILVADSPSETTVWEPSAPVDEVDGELRVNGVSRLTLPSAPPTATLSYNGATWT